MNDHEKKGSGAQYFDLTLPENNFIDKLWRSGIDQNEHISSIAGYLLFRNEDDYQVQKKILVDFLQKDNLDDQKPLAYRKIDSDDYLAHYKNNRNNFVHSIAQLMQPKRSKEDIELAKKTILRGVELGIHPLEKDMRFGATAFSHSLSNAHMDLEMVKFFASLHPDSFTNLSEDKETVMQVVLRCNRKKEIVNWVINEMPLDAIQTNIDSIMKKKNKSNKASDAIDALTARLEQARLNESIVKGCERKAANKL